MKSTEIEEVEKDVQSIVRSCWDVKVNVEMGVEHYITITTEYLDDVDLIRLAQIRNTHTFLLMHISPVSSNKFEVTLR